ncbi:helix-turn-helix domain-containing protein [Streptomyces sp. NPDC003522]
MEDVAKFPVKGGRATHFKSAIHLTARQIRESQRISQEWKGGPLAHLARLTIPQPSVDRGFKFSANGRLFGDLFFARVYCDSLAGISGNDADQDPIVAHLVTSGRLIYTRNGVSHTAVPGQILIRDARTTWDFTCAPATRAHAVTIPRQLVLSRMGSPKSLGKAYVSDVTTPEVRFLQNFLEALEKSSGDLDRSVAAQEIARDACATLFSGLLSDRLSSGMQDHSNATMHAARNVIEKNLDKKDLSPVMVSRLIGVSLRTLHRSFSGSNDSVMSFIRRRRLERAHDELLQRGANANVSEIAAHWQFADASHFIRYFKSFYGTTPAAYLRNFGAAGKEY